MKAEYSKAVFLSLLGAVLSASSTSHAHEKSLINSSSDLEVASAFRVLVQKGLISVDKVTGKVFIEAAIYDLLDSAGVVEHVQPTDLQSAKCELSTVTATWTED